CPATALAGAPKSGKPGVRSLISANLFNELILKSAGAARFLRDFLLQFPGSVVNSSDAPKRSRN
ncbi:MAG: hypothetical protein KDA39_07655, partial [Hyphomonas sp.]|nr:hypothetical protein [Hyphomonas sp.]